MPSLMNFNNLLMSERSKSEFRDFCKYSLKTVVKFYDDHVLKRLPNRAKAPTSEWRGK